MIVLVEIKTPKGEALKTSKRINGFMIPTRVKMKSWVNDDDDTIYWEVTGSVRDCLKVNRNVAYYDNIMRGALRTSMVKGQMRKMSPEDNEALEDMLLNQTRLTIIKQEQQNELDEFNFTWWDRVKQKFRLL